MSIPTYPCPIRCVPLRRRIFSRWLFICAVAFALALPSVTSAAPIIVPKSFETEIQPLLRNYCFDCHGDGANKGKVAFDDPTLIAKPELWQAVLKNTRAGLMPPEKKTRPTAAEQLQLETWIKRDIFHLDPQHPDPGRVTLRRLNRVEYHNTIRDLMGFDFKVDDELPPDDTGYGFDNIGDVLTVSPMLLEKYMQAAEKIVDAAVPRVERVIAEHTLIGPGTKGRGNEKLTFYETAKIARAFTAKNPGNYRLALEFEILGQFDFDPGRCNLSLSADGHVIWHDQFGWENGKKFTFVVDQQWQAGDHQLALDLTPLTAIARKTNSLDLRVLALRVHGPLDPKLYVRPRNFELFFSHDVPRSARERRDYARDILRRFATRAFRRPVDERSLDRLVKIAETTYREPGKVFEDGVAQAMIRILASPRFLFHVEEAGKDSTREATRSKLPRTASGSHSNSNSNSPSRLNPAGAPASSDIDEYALASRLSYFLWSTLPDDELFQLAARGELRSHLAAQVNRLLADPRSSQLTENFVGQWLQVRDVEGIDINARAVLARDSGQERGMNASRRRFEELRSIPDEKLTPEQKAEIEELRAGFKRRFGNKPQVELDRDLRRALKQETEMCFAYVMRENRSVLELLESDYTFLNEKLAKHYGMTNVIGQEMRRVTLPPDSPRGGVLTHGAALIVTSNPTRTSPVKRGLFILDNILGIPTPPPPPDIPNLEDSEKEVAGHQPTLRETLAIHREKPLCASCHNRMDPLGLALENFNALGMWRDKERGQPIEATGRLCTGEEFANFRDVKHALVTRHHLDYYRCLTEKLLTYALGRGVEIYDLETMDSIVARLEKDHGRFSSLLMGIVESAPFQKRRSAAAQAASEPPKPAEQRAELKP